jgi:hypothetical protein
MIRTDWPACSATGRETLASKIFFMPVEDAATTSPGSATG